jgi:hypothetical protein
VTVAAVPFALALCIAIDGRGAPDLLAAVGAAGWINQAARLMGMVSFCIGALAVVLNLYLGFVRPLLFRLRHGDYEGYRYSSGVPFVGTWLVAAGVILWSPQRLVGGLALLLVLSDTGGFHWFVIQTWREPEIWGPKGIDRQPK